LRPLSERRDALRRLYEGLVKHEKALHAALYADLRKSELEAYMAETGFTRDELTHTLAHLGAWARPKRVLAPLAHQPAWGWVHREPLGTVLIIAPWNYPVQLALSPLVCALAGGNTAVVKPSELTPNVSDALAALIKDTFSPDEVQVVAGGVAETTALLEQPWDHIFFTGSTQVGQIVYRAAAETMSPVTLELGGKSPAIIAEDAPLALTARRLVWGKFANAGQTCVAPDYLLVPEGNVAALVSELKREIEAQFGANPQASPDYGRLVNERNFHRVAGYLTGGHVAHGGQHDAADKYLAPTVLTDVDLDHAVMQDEIFGPVLPIIPYKSLSDALAFTNARPKPLASYVFTQSGATERAVVEGLNAGGTLINDTLLHLANGNLPFGGVGTSGIGQYHGRFGFETFTRPRGVMKKPFLLDQFVRYAPVKDWQVKLSRWFIG
jgi:aldehyde dehydrogenase (NAD+)